MDPNVGELEKADVGFEFYWKEIVLLAGALIMPVLTWVLTHDGSLLSRSGSLVVFCSALSEFTLLNKANVKHLRNAMRVHSGEKPLNFSTPATVIGYVSLAVAILGTLLWGYGDLLCRT